MKKTLRLLVILVGTLLLLTGCAKMDYTVDVKDDGKAEVSYVIAIENEYVVEDKNDLTNAATQSLDTTTDDGKKVTNSETTNIYLETLKAKAADAEKKGYTTKEFKDGKYTGYTITKSFDKVEEISLQDAFGKDVIKNDSDAKIKFEKNGSNIKISQDATFDLTQYAQGYEIIYTVKLPVKVKENNATKVDGNQLTWVLTENQTENQYGSETATTEQTKKVSFTAEGGASIVSNISESFSKTSIAGIIGGVIGLIILIVIVVVVVIIICVSKSNKKTNTVTTVQTTEPEQKVEEVNNDKKVDENK